MNELQQIISDCYRIAQVVADLAPYMVLMVLGIAFVVGVVLVTRSQV